MAFHDDILDRVTDGRGAINSLTAAEIEAADAGYHFSPDGGSTFPWRDRGVRVPRLTELLERWPHARINIDTKSDAVVAPLIALLAEMNAFDRVCVGSFSDARIARARRLAGGRLCTSMGPRAVTAARVASYSGRIPRLGADCLQIPVSIRGVRLVDHVMVRAAHRAGMAVHVWTIDDQAQMELLLDLGVDGIMTDRPGRLREVLRRRGAWFGPEE
jgi:glycerophosphoryl diester phosphodiesterase